MDKKDIDCKIIRKIATLSRSAGNRTPEQNERKEELRHGE